MICLHWKFDLTTRAMIVKTKHILHAVSTFLYPSPSSYNSNDVWSFAFGGNQGGNLRYYRSSILTDVVLSTIVDRFHMLLTLKFNVLPRNYLFYVLRDVEDGSNRSMYCCSKTEKLSEQHGRSERENFVWYRGSQREVIIALHACFSRKKTRKPL